jgi:prepilin-type processing-associated H-X9-DG protein
VELLVVLGIISALMAMLMPALSAARAQSQMIACESNVRQLLMAVQAYTCTYRKYPPNITVPAPGMCWHDQDRLGPFVSCTVASDRSLIGGIMVCPADEGAQRSYAMNVWASSKLDSYVIKGSGTITGTQWPSTPPDSSQMILIAEKWATNKLAGGWVTEEPFGYAGLTPGERFGANSGIAPERAENGWIVNCELPYARHRPRNSNGTGVQPIGRVTIGYADGHVEMKSNDELADAVSGLSTLDSLWSPLDPTINH